MHVLSSHSTCSVAFSFAFVAFWCLQKGNRIAGDPVHFFMAHKKGLKKSYNSFLFD